MKVAKHKKLYCYTQEKWLPKADKFNWWEQNTIMRYVISDHMLQRGNQYEIAENLGLNIYKYFEQYWTTPYTDIQPEEEKNTGNIVTEEVNIACHGYHGLYQMLPFLEDGHVLVFNFTIEFDTEDCEGYIEDEFNEVEPIEDPDYFAKQEFWAVNRYDDVLMGWKDDKPWWNIDDGYVKWDVSDRSVGAIIENTSPIFPMFPQSLTDEHGVEKPYKVTIKIEGKYYCHSHDYTENKDVLK